MKDIPPARMVVSTEFLEEVRRLTTPTPAGSFHGILIRSSPFMPPGRAVVEDAQGRVIQILDIEEPR